MENPIEVRIQCARGEILNAVQRISDEQGLPVTVVDGVLASVLAEIRAQGEMELINAYIALKKESEAKIGELNGELEEAKKAAKKVLKAPEEKAPEEKTPEEKTPEEKAPEETEPEADQEGDADDGGGDETDN